ncbi:MAG: glutamyl-tRNA reductase [Peptococcaceae bacterium]|jgi:glutamyl-tRNA reductase|nr:glutamyl-tRNA reductase [Peptococcaceae bacterium]MDH7525803.1 glutamyl-tRNA reductase [Peptococcaceae bacterium]
MPIAVFGLNHRSAPVEIREKLSFSRSRIAAQKEEIGGLQEVEGAVILSTCNRTEFYVTTQNPAGSRRSLLGFAARYSACPPETLGRHIYWKEGREAVHHLFRVAAGLDSMMLGESQVLGQVEDAYNYAREYGISNNILNPLFQKAIEVGKRVRTETRIDRQALSVGSAAVEMAREFFGGLEGRVVLVLGAGETGELAARHLAAGGVGAVLVANRTYERALRLARELNGEAVCFAGFMSCLEKADLVIGSTAAPHYVVRAADVERVLAKRKGRPLLFIDLAVPRDIEPAVALLENVSLHDVDDLQGVIGKNLEERKKEAAKAELLVREDLNKFFEWYDSLFVIPTIAALKEKAEKIKEKELEKALRKLGGLSEKEKKVIMSMAGSIVNKFLYDPIINLKECARSDSGRLYTETINKLFNLSSEGKEMSGEDAV